MPFYRDAGGNTHWLDVGVKTPASFPSDAVEITDEEAFAILNPPPTDEQIAAQLEAAVDAHIDAIAQAKGYDSRITCALRAGYVNPWQAEGIAFGEWMDACYVYCYQVMSDVQAGSRAIPTADELIAELPVMGWP